ncbi:hypothetical protein GIB67_012659 [Kingdonia uniflora]|uniref:Uncharacterized protein n=1 Tax=Kingdonia uniflora TaxID=39325 RepID=A0A7J7NFJ7_9MAGN|nr:hypothetical protein GIB67_012659 [Kingdonia uniflora]
MMRATKILFQMALLGVIRFSLSKKTIYKILRDVNGIVRPSRYEMLAELSRREKGAGIKLDPAIGAFMKATALAGQETSLVTNYILKILGLDICVDIMVADDMRRGISGEMLVGPTKALFMDEISTGLDSTLTFQIVKFVKQMVHIMNVTMIISLLQSPPETFDLFDDVILL